MLIHRLLAAAATLPLVSSLVCQNTTWTSFEDRRGHAIAGMPNGAVLMFGGESVDSAGTLLGDTKSLSSTTWTKADGGEPPTPRRDHAMTGLNYLGLPLFVAFGGQTDGGASAETFRYEGGGWGKVTGSVGATPSARIGHAMVPNLQAQTVLMFGGEDLNGVPLNDLWEFDPATDSWTMLTPTGAPPSPRFNHCMVYNPASHAMFVFGGSGFLDDTWKYDIAADSWSPVSSPTHPSARQSAAMAFLANYAHVVLFGGMDAAQNGLSDTWLLSASGTWTQVFPATVPPGRLEHAMSRAGNNRVVMLGGTSSGSSTTVLHGTWLWDGLDWTEQNAPPSQRTRAAMAFDSGRGVHVAFGGLSQSGGADLGDTWELDGLNWVPRTPSPAPSPRAEAGMAYDAARGVTVLYGGITGGSCGTPLGDTWEWNGSNWTSIVTSPTPPAAGGVQPVYDSKRNVVWMLVGKDMWEYDGTWRQASQPERAAFGHTYDAGRGRLIMTCGGGGSPGLKNDVWEWDGVRWLLRTPLGSVPAERTGTSLAYHPGIGCLLFAGQGASGNYGDTWSWDGISWTQQAGVLTATTYPALAFHPGLQKSIRFGGTITSTTFSNETKLWEPIGTWQGFGGATPTGRWAAAMTYDPLRNEIVMFGGSRQVGTPNDFGDTWTFNGSSWTLKSNSGPSPRSSAIGWDATTQKVILFGGLSYGPSTFYADTWLWNGTSWAQAAPAHVPPARRHHAIESFAGRTIMWGGDIPGAINRADMWEWTGTDWSEISGTPPELVNYGAAYDARRDRVVVFGGSSSCGGANLNETWEWDGGAWHRRTPAQSPSPAPRVRAHLAYDESRSRVVLFGGTNGTTIYNDTWEWDGDAGIWISRNVVNAAPATDGHTMSYDAERELTVAFGTFGTWDYGAIRPGTVESIPTSALCTSSLGSTPQIGPTAWCGPWLGDSIGVEFAAVPPSLALMVIGFTPLPSIPLPPPLSTGLCTLDVNLDLLEVLFPLPAPYVSGPLPNNVALLGTELYMQAAFFDLALPGTPIITSNSLHLTVGAR